MLNVIVKSLTKKELVLVNWHRNTQPFLNVPSRDKFIFLDYMPLWKSTRILGRSTRLRYHAMATILSLIKPAYIIDINWITKLNRLLYMWCRKHRPSQFIVVQHGLYIGGIITEKAHKYAKCDIMLCWGEQSIQELHRYNRRRKTLFIRWGNPIYNDYNRDLMQFKTDLDRKVLVAPTLLVGYRKAIYEELIARLISLGFEVYIKEHKYQPSRSQHIEGAPRITGDLYSILEQQEYDLVFSDTSTCLVDALFFKNRVLFFSPAGDLPEYLDNAYSRRLVNQVDHFKNWKSCKDVYRCIDLEAQEVSLSEIVFEGSNDLSRLPSV